MSFADDFAAYAAQRRLQLQDARYANAIAIIALVETAPQPLSEAVESERDRLLKEMQTIDAEFAHLASAEQVYRARDHRRREERPRPTDNSLLKNVRRKAPRVIRKLVDGPPPALNCSLAGADPPWQWAWGDYGGFKPFSEMASTSFCDGDLENG